MYTMRNKNLRGALPLEEYSAAAQVFPSIPDTGSTAPTPILRSEGKAKRVSEIVVTCTGGNPAKSIFVNVSPFLNTNLACLFRRFGKEYVELSESFPTAVRARRNSPAGPVRWKTLSGVAALLACGALIGYFIPPTTNPPHRVAAKDIGLAVRRDGATLAVSWNQASPIVQKGSSGVLTILDGIYQSNIPLTSSQLRSSDAIAYRPQSIAVDFQLDVYLGRNRFNDQNLVVVGPPQPIPSPVIEKGTARRVFARSH